LLNDRIAFILVKVLQHICHQDAVKLRWSFQEVCNILHIYLIVALPKWGGIILKALNTYKVGLIRPNTKVKPIPHPGTINAVANTEVKDRFWGVHQYLTHHISEGRVRADRHGVGLCV
jgi:hypothetical protein